MLVSPKPLDPLYQIVSLDCIILKKPSEQEVINKSICLVLEGAKNCLACSVKQHSSCLSAWFLAINPDVNGKIVNVTAIQKEFNLTVPIVIGTFVELSQAFHLMTTTYHLLLTQDGRIVFREDELSN
jgi:hypothetical protein